MLLLSKFYIACNEPEQVTRICFGLMLLFEMMKLDE